MTDSRAALGSDRLPWLSDEPKAVAPARAARRNGGIGNLWAPAAGLLLAVAAASYWLGTRTADQDLPQASDAGPSVVAPLPQPQIQAPPQVELAPQPEIEPTPVPQVRSAPQRDLPIERPRPVRRVIVQNPEAPPAEGAEESASASSSAQPAAKPVVNPDSKPLKAWPAWQSAGAEGRIVRIGAFGTREQAKLGWRYMVRAYPAVAHLKATVVADHNSRGRRFYRFQIGTTSQAHSEVLCQRMERIHFSCAVVGLPWKPKGVER